MQPPRVRFSDRRLAATFVLIAAAFAGVRSGGGDRFSTPGGAGLRGGTICTVATKDYDCSDCINDITCNAQFSAKCQSYTGSLCLECMLGQPSDCPGPEHKYYAGTNCFLQYTVYYPKCTDRQYVPADNTGCPGSCA